MTGRLDVGAFPKTSANAVVFLASPRSDMIIGKFLTVDGGDRPPATRIDQGQLSIGQSGDALLGNGDRVGAGREHALQVRYLHPSTLPG